jgi:hypothetical protein
MQNLRQHRCTEIVEPAVFLPKTDLCETVIQQIATVAGRFEQTVMMAFNNGHRLHITSATV